MALYYVILDSGHNEYVAGKRSPKNLLAEWSWNNEVQKKLKKRLEEHDIIVYLTNPSPAGKNEIGLRSRCNLANAKWKEWGKPTNCLFISIHGNASGIGKDSEGWCNPRGVEVYTAHNGSAKSRQACSLICDSIYNDISKLDSKFKNRGSKVENFTVIYGVYMQAILIEHGFYDNRSDCNLMLNHINDFVEADLKGICKYFGITYKAPIGNTSAPPTQSEKPNNTNSVYSGGTDVTDFVVKIKVDSLNIRYGPGTTYKVVSSITDKGKYTITHTKDGWGKLKSGVGWINVSSSYVDKISTSASTTQKDTDTPSPSKKSDWVLRLQKELNKQGYKDYNNQKLSEDGYTGKKTLSACPPLYRGKKGNIVKLLQQRLGIDADGSFGPATKQAIKDFQKKNKLSIDGSCGPATWKKILGL